MIREQILKQLEQLPESLQVEVLHYVEYLSSQYREMDDTAYLNAIPSYVDSMIKSPRSDEARLSQASLAELELWAERTGF